MENKWKNAIHDIFRCQYVLFFTLSLSRSSAYLSWCYFIYLLFFYLHVIIINTFMPYRNNERTQEKKLKRKSSRYVFTWLVHIHTQKIHTSWNKRINFQLLFIYVTKSGIVASTVRYEYSFHLMYVCIGIIYITVPTKI